MIFCYSNEEIYGILIMTWQKRRQKVKQGRKKGGGERERERERELTQVSILISA